MVGIKCLRPDLSALDQASKPGPGLPAPSANAALSHGSNTLSVVAGAVTGVSISRLASRASLVASKRTVDGSKVLLLAGRADHVLSSLGNPTVDEVTVRAPRRSACQLERRGSRPAIRQGLAEIVADGEAELGHGLHASRAPVGCAVLTALVTGLESLLVDALGEVEELLNVGAAGLGRETVSVKGDALAFTGPLGLCVGVHGVLGHGAGLASNHHQVLRDGDLGRGLAQVVVCAEAEDGYGLVVLAILGVEESRNPVGGQIVGVLGAGATLLEFSTGLCAGNDGVGAVERVEMRLVELAREDNGINVLLHERRRNLDDGVRVCELSDKGRSEKSVKRHPVSW
jgi:hypothetical protein